MKRVNICNIPIDVLTMNQTLRIIDHAIVSDNPIHHVAINASKVVNAQKDQELKKSIVSCDIINADGQSIVWASRFLNTPLPERITGIDLMEQVIKLASERKYKIFFLGANEEVVVKVVNHYSSTYNESIIAGYQNGYFKKENEIHIAERICKSDAKILFVAMTSPKKEIFLNSFKDVINIPFVMGVGGSFDVISGLVKRAPSWMQKGGIEWLYRLIQEPRRMWKRYLFGNLTFIYLVLKQKLKGKSSKSFT